jgi:hypothetical protein
MSSPPPTREGFALYVDDYEKLINQIEANHGLKMTELDIGAEQPKAKAAEKATEAQPERIAKSPRRFRTRSPFPCRRNIWA